MSLVFYFLWPDNHSRHGQSMFGSQISSPGQTKRVASGFDSVISLPPTESFNDLAAILTLIAFQDDKVEPFAVGVRVAKFAAKSRVPAGGRCLNLNFISSLSRESRRKIASRSIPLAHARGSVRNRSISAPSRSRLCLEPINYTAADRTCRADAADWAE
jgi:hypothetical protein